MTNNIPLSQMTRFEGSCALCWERAMLIKIERPTNTSAVCIDCLPQTKRLGYTES